jgi:hypothetical protein
LNTHSGCAIRQKVRKHPTYTLLHTHTQTQFVIRARGVCLCALHMLQPKKRDVHRYAREIFVFSSCPWLAEKIGAVYHAMQAGTFRTYLVNRLSEGGVRPLAPNSPPRQSQELTYQNSQHYKISMGKVDLQQTHWYVTRCVVYIPLGHIPPNMHACSPLRTRILVIYLCVCTIHSTQE